MSSTTVVIVDRTKTVSVEHKTPVIAPVLNPAAVTAVTNKPPRVTDVERELDGVEIIETLQQGPPGVQGPPGPPGQDGAADIPEFLDGGNF